jgi:4-hydroxysphinganine ceramide fatty acyl 2-hydroxylase
MENMTKTHPVVIYSMYMPVIIGMLYYGAAYKGLSVGREVLFFIIGADAWPMSGLPAWSRRAWRLIC